MAKATRKKKPSVGGGKRGDSIADTLASLRKGIDAADRELLRLLGARAALVAKIGKAKQIHDQPVHQPAREAQLLRGLIERHKGGYPAASILRIWREIIAASVRLQTDFRVAIPANSPEIAALARAHYGEVTPIVERANPLAAVRAGRATAAVMPLPGGGGAGLWWRRFALARPDGLSVIWRLPFLGPAEPAACVVGRTRSAPSGPGNAGDCTWLAVEGDPSAREPARVRRIARSGRLRLVELDGYISASDAESAWPKSRSADKITWLGAFPRPLGDTGAPGGG